MSSALFHLAGALFLVLAAVFLFATSFLLAALLVSSAPFHLAGTLFLLATFFLITLFLVALFLCSFFLASLIAELTESLHDGFLVGLVSIVLNSHSLFVDIGLHALDTFFETQVALDLSFTALAMHLRQCGYYNGLNVLSKCDCCNEQHGQQHGCFFHCLFIFIGLFVFFLYVFSEVTGFASLVEIFGDATGTDKGILAPSYPRTSAPPEDVC